VDLPGFLTEIVFAATTNDYTQPLAPSFSPSSSETQITTPPSNVIISQSLHRYANIIYDNNQKGSQLAFFNLPTGFVCLVKTCALPKHKATVSKLDGIKTIQASDLSSRLFPETSISEFNHLLFRCSNEETDITPKDPRGPYGLKSGQFKYAGL